MLTLFISYVQIFPIQPYKKGPITSNPRQKCAAAYLGLQASIQSARIETNCLEGDRETQLQMADGEKEELSCVVFKDLWSGESSALLDTAQYCGKLELIDIRRGYTQGAWALALRWLGAQALAAETSRHTSLQ